ncbi:transcriptional regulator, LysR family [Arcobacter venerupis]|uniref:Transcriptional regulator, LysR family n=1 Tax=Arcobacter venerupis TaxID=1054033 RepID=A0AAE7BA11_9BACT|nr:LysR family transcriptional regulator [Arcobacter venerupis]QKF66542.1 transcriptional regulator, LysR family [Arcobacter venerupis]RWS49719.1 LysR family transcriptional regulator [Arcobacter venerupis]
MDSSLLKVFVSVANRKSISLGALDLGFTQSNVTLRIKQLEKVIGYSLFHRTPKGVILSKEGEKLYPFAIEIVKKVEEAQLQMKNISHQEILRIGTSQANAAIRILSFTDKLNKKFPDMKIEISTNGTPKVIEDLLDYKIDIGFVAGDPNHKDIVVLNKFDDDLYFIESKGKKSPNCLIGYREDSTHFKYLQEYMRNNGNSDFKIMVIQNYDVMQGFVKAGFGKAFLSKALIDKYGYSNDFILKKIEGSDEILATHLICRKDYMPMISNYLKKISIKNN